MAEIGKDIAKAKALLEQGELVAIPTETVYGLAGNALDANAVTKIFKVKDRPYFDPLIVHVSGLNSAEGLVETIPSKAEKLIAKFWPGPLTILLKRKSIIPDLVTAGLETVGIRCPDHSLTNELLRSLNFPLAAPSANPFGYVSPTNPSHVNEQLGEKIKYILDGGECKVGIESTIIGFENDDSVLYRLGGLNIEQIESIVGKTLVELNSSSNPQAPGQLTSHYAPRKRLILRLLSNSLKKYQSRKVGVLQNQYILSPTGDLEIAAQNLFSALRELDKLDIEFILAEEVPDIGLGRAINDRLRRASAAEEE
jgi:L-threonylcarbamoyladenylate synthase